VVHLVLRKKALKKVIYLLNTPPCSCIQDFVRLPWQNQSSHSSHVIPAGSASSGASGLASAYGSVSSDVASEAIESNSAALLRCSIAIDWCLIFFIFKILNC